MAANYVLRHLKYDSNETALLNNNFILANGLYFLLFSLSLRVLKCYAMSAVTNQPLPFDRLEREKHIQMIFRAFHNHCGPSCECLTHSSGLRPHPTPPAQESDQQQSRLAPERKMENMQLLGKVNRPEVQEQWPGGAGASNFMSMLETVSQIHITARPELQGEQKGLLVCI